MNEVTWWILIAAIFVVAATVELVLRLARGVSVLRSLCDEIGRDPATIVMSVEAVLALAPDDAALQTVRQVAEKRFGGPGFGLNDGGLIGTPQAIVDRLGALREMGFDQVVLFTHDRASDATLELLGGEVLPHV